MKLGKKLAALGLVGVMALGQSVSALAAMGFTMTTPSVILSGRTSGYSIISKCVLDSSYSHYYLSVSHTLGYINSVGVQDETNPVYDLSRTVTASHISQVLLSGSNISESKIYSAIARGYYRPGANSSDVFVGRKENKFR